MNYLYYPLFGSTCFGLSPVHHQEHHLMNCITLWYVRAGESSCCVDVHPLFGSTCFGLSPVHHQEHHHINCTAHWYVRAGESSCCNTGPRTLSQTTYNLTTVIPDVLRSTLMIFFPFRVFLFLIFN